MDLLSIEYIFQLEDQLLTYLVEINKKTLECITHEAATLPVWTQLEFNQCSHCPLAPEQSPHCPIALHLARLTPLVKDRNSYDEVELTVKFSDREVILETTLQRAVGSLLGLIIGTSACPHTYIFKPMARFHQPLANHMETTFRACATYLIAQYLRHQQGNNVDLDLKGLKQAYHNIQIVNKALAERIRHSGERDTAVNAVILLDLLAKEVPYSIDETLEELQHMFIPYMNQHP